MTKTKSTSLTRSTNRWHRWLLAMTLGIVFVLGYASQGARAEDNEDELPDKKLFNQFMHSFGLRREGDFIDYHERPPLVLPPGRDLPAPETNAKAPKPASWPDDPDVKRAKKQKTERKAYNVDPIDESRPMLPNAYTLPGGGSPANRPSGPTRTAEDEQRAMSPKELGSKSFLSSWWSPNKEEYATFTTEPSRARLIDPPTGYRTPSPDQPYGVGKTTWTGKSKSPDTHNDVVR